MGLTTHEGRNGPSQSSSPSRPVSPSVSAGGSAEMVALEHEAATQAANVVVIAVPLASVLLAAWLAWGGSLHWHDLLVLAITYALTGLGITVGYHRLFTHRSFQTTRALRAVFAVLGSMAVEGP